MKICLVFNFMTWVEVYDDKYSTINDTNSFQNVSIQFKYEKESNYFRVISSFIILSVISKFIQPSRKHLDCLNTYFCIKEKGMSEERVNVA